MIRPILRGKAFLFLTLFVPIWLAFSPALGQPDQKTVLILHSYHYSPWTNSLLEGINSVLGDLAEVDLVLEYMDTKKINNEKYFRALEEIYQLKYGSTRFDAIITSDDNAYRFAPKKVKCNRL